MTFKLKPKYPSEHQEQSALIRWAWYRSATLPELNLLFAIPNGGRRDAATGAMLKREGTKRGVPDLFLAVARGSCAGLFLELKRREGGRISPEQADWHDRLRAAGYAVVVAYGFDEAVRAIESYLETGERVCEKQ